MRSVALPSVLALACFGSWNLIQPPQGKGGGMQIGVVDFSVAANNHPDYGVLFGESSDFAKQFEKIRAEATELERQKDVAMAEARGLQRGTDQRDRFEMKAANLGTQLRNHTAFMRNWLRRKKSLLSLELRGAVMRALADYAKAKKLDMVLRLHVERPKTPLAERLALANDQVILHHAQRVNITKDFVDYLKTLTPTKRAGKSPSGNGGK